MKTIRCRQRLPALKLGKRHKKLMRMRLRPMIKRIKSPLQSPAPKRGKPNAKLRLNKQKKMVRTHEFFHCTIAPSPPKAHDNDHHASRFVGHGARRARTTLLFWLGHFLATDHCRKHRCCR